MNLQDKVAVVTGGAMGIGRALCQRFAAEGARAVVVADLEFDKAQQVAAEIGGVAVKTDVSNEADIINLVKQATEQFGRIDLFCSNAGIIGKPGGAEVSNEDWQEIFGVNVMAHIYAARAVLPQMIERGEGYLLQTASAAGLLTQIGSAPYSVTKHAAVAFAEWLSITHADRGLKVSCLCPQGVRTRMLLGEDGTGENFLVAGSVSPEEVADCVIKGLAEERFLILPHPEVADYFQRKANDYDRWLRGMRRLQANVLDKR
ncbi:MAG TPA: SDR family oxidoreductase [Blastocatellia bacterium]|jgi:NAD(P)-dependent dehydrogenase (short-subunit alcohol dehydrogenase family)